MQFSCREQSSDLPIGIIFAWLTERVSSRKQSSGDGAEINCQPLQSRRDRESRDARNRVGTSLLMTSFEEYQGRLFEAVRESHCHGGSTVE